MLIFHKYTPDLTTTWWYNAFLKTIFALPIINIIGKKNSNGWKDIYLWKKLPTYRTAVFKAIKRFLQCASNRCSQRRWKSCLFLYAYLLLWRFCASTVFLSSACLAERGSSPFSVHSMSESPCWSSELHVLSSLSVFHLWLQLESFSGLNSI